MTRDFILSAIALACCGIFAPCCSLTSSLPRAAELSAAAQHICSGCPTCERAPRPWLQTSKHACVDHLHRSGHPETQGRFAKPSLSQHYSFGYIGGGAAFRGEPRSPDEGTWGVDYSGILIKKHIWLPWLHGRREPRHDGSYQTDGPHLLQH